MSCRERLIGVVALGVFLSAGTSFQAADDNPARITETPRSPIGFEPNHGQFHPDVQFVSRGAGYTLFLTDTEAVVSLRGSHAGATAGQANDRSVIRLALENARPRQPIGIERQPGVVNYLISRDPANWRTGIATYSRVAYDDVYPGIDLVYYGRDAAHEYDLVVAPGADPSRISLRVTGADRVDLDSAGHLQMATTAGTITMRAPHVYQLRDGVQQAVPARYAINGVGTIGFELTAYDRTVPLVIDPELVYGTFLGGTGTGNGYDFANGVSVDAEGFAYVVGWTESADFPTERPLQSQRRGDLDAVVTKLTPDGIQRVYATYLGGDRSDDATAINVRADGVAYVFGSTSSSDFPVRSDAFQRVHGGGSDAYLVELNREGSAIVNGTYLGGSGGESALGLELTRFEDRDADPAASGTPDVFGDWIFVYGTTDSPNFPTLQAAQDRRVGTRDGFVTVFHRNTLQAFYSTYVGAEGNNLPEGMTINPARGDIYLFLQRNDDDGPFLAHLKPVELPSSPSAGDRVRPTGIMVGDELSWKNMKLKLQYEDLLKREAELRDKVEQVKAKLKAAKKLKCKIAATQKRVADLEKQLKSLCSGSASGANDTNMNGVRGSAQPMATADQLARAVTAVVMPGCFPVPPAATCNDRAVLVFYDADLEVITHVNFGGQRVGREFIPTQAVVDREGRFHIIGKTSDNNLPVVSPIQASPAGSSEGFILTFDPLAGTTSFYSYLGGRAFDTLSDIAIDKDGNRWIVGTTQSDNFPVTRSGVQTELRGRMDGFVVKITP